MNRFPSVRHSRFQKILILCGALFVLYLGFGFLAIPFVGKWYINQKLPEKIGRIVAVEDIDLNPLLFSLRVTNLTLEDDLKDEFLRVGNCYINLQLLPTVFGQITLKTFQLSDSSFRAVLNNEGLFNFDGLITNDSESPDLETEDDALQSQEKGDAFELPKVRIQKIQLNQLVFEFEDRSLQDTFKKDFHIDDLSVLELNTYPDKEIPLSLHANIANTGQLGLTADILSLYPLDLKLDFRLTGFDLASIQPYLSEYTEVELKGEFGAAFQSSLQFHDGKLVCLLESDSLITVDDLKIRDLSHEQGMLNARQVGFRNVRLDTLAGSCNYSIEIFDPEIELTRKANGLIQLPTQRTSEAVERENEVVVKDEQETHPLAMMAILDSLKVSGGIVKFNDQSLQLPAAIALQNVEIQVQNFFFDVGESQVSGDLVASTTLDLDQGGSIQLRAEGDLSTNALLFDLGIADINLSQFQPYVGEYLRGRVDSGLFSSQLGANYQFADKQFKVIGAAQIKDVRLLDEETDTIVAGINEVNLNNIQVDNHSAQLASIEITAPEGRFFIAEDQRNTLNRLVIAGEKSAVEEAVSETAVDNSEETPSEPSFTVSLGKVTVSDGSFEFVDNSISPVFKTRMSKLNLELNDFSTIPQSVSTFELSARVNDAAELRGRGESTLADPTSHTNLDVKLSAFDLSSASTYGQKFVGRKIDRGHFFLDSKIVVSEQELKGENKLTLKSFTLGDRVESEVASGLPIGLAVAVLQDSNGVIKQSIPIRGDLSEPGVPVGRVALNATVKALRNVILKTATSPFKLLIGMVDGEQDMDVLGFEAGQSNLNKSNASKLNSLAKALENRPRLKVEIETHFDPLQEREYLREQLLFLSLEDYAGGDLIVPEIIHPMEQLCNRTFDRQLLMDRLSFALSKGLGQELKPATDESAEETAVVSSNDLSEENGGSSEDDPNSGNFIVHTFGFITGIFSDEKVNTDVTQMEDSVGGDNEVMKDFDQSNEPVPLVAATEDDLIRALEWIPLDAVKDHWIQELAIARMNAVSKVLVDKKGIDPERLFFNQNPIPSDASSIQFKLTD